MKVFVVCYCVFGSLESPLLWIRGDPELEYLAELNLRQPEPMWVCVNGSRSMQKQLMSYL